MIKIGLSYLALATILTVAWATKEGRQFGIVDVVKFQNDVCDGGSLNGTCFTAEECETKGGKSSKSCAEGFGVCCTFELSCGGSSSSNNTYITQSSTTTRPAVVCVHTICPQASSIARMRFDFTTLQIATMNVATITAVGTKNADSVKGQGVTGHCTTDQLVISGSGNSATPILCGTMTGEHVVVDSDGETCSRVAFAFSSTSATRTWSIWVTQYTKGDMDATRAGPPGCLQFFTGTTGFVHSFTHGAMSTGATTATQAHLANVDYTICIRRESGKTIIAYYVITPTSSPAGKAGTKATAQGTFGLGVSSKAKTAHGTANEKCTADYLEFSGLETGTTGAPTSSAVFRTCGRLFGTDTASVHDTLYTTITPFTIKVVADANEVSVSTAASKMTKREGDGYPSGTLGFGLLYAQT